MAMARRFLQFGTLAALLLGLWTPSAPAQDGQRIREWQARREAAAKQEGKGQPNERAMEGLPGKWIERLRDMPPEQQQRFLQNNAQFRALPPERQQQIRKNLANWNQKTPEEKTEIITREQALERMTPEQRAYVKNTLLPRWQTMPPERRQAINRHLAMLRNMSPATQQAALRDPKFTQGLSPDEQSMLRDLNSLRNPAPDMPAAPPQ
jgi:hypothetical protein